MTKKCLHHENEFYQSWIKTSDQYLSNNFNLLDPPEYLSCLTVCKNINNKIKRKRRPRKTINECGRTSTPVQRGSDSAFSLSPVITEISNGFDSSLSGDISLEEPIVMNRSHTYVNVLNSEITQFEDITQVEKILATALSITNV
ncbi:hypothetical protein LOAG_05110 [Loa loa]|nr:hypothetical protein LOAG_05110 [Loa loa]EFO23376.1 hypothetical protein LOAG_05110 [Loa loa]